MKIIRVLTLLFPLIILGHTAPSMGGETKLVEGFLFSHTKGETCAQKWLFMEKLIEKDGVRCNETYQIKGFPYLRGNLQVLQMAPDLSSKYALHQWLELLRRIDLQARYIELSTLPENDLKEFCQQAGIECFQGRIRSYVARCSSIIMGDEKRNHDFMQILKKNALVAAKERIHGNKQCFSNPETLDDLVTTDVLHHITAPRKKTGGRPSSSYLEQRIQRSKQASRP